jgi:hypothetical protein
MGQYANNLSVIDLSGANNNPTNVAIPGATITANAEAAIVSFFQGLTGNNDAGKLLASSIIFTSAMQGIDPIGLIEEFKNLPAGQLTSYLAAFLNLNRISTSLLGVQNQPKVSKYVQRSIIA